MINRKFIRTYKHPWADNIQVLISEHKDGKIFVASDLLMREANPAEIYDPTLYLRREEAQDLMDSLWDCGLRPSEGTGSAGALVATQKHLEDMRKLVFEK